MIADTLLQVFFTYSAFMFLTKWKTIVHFCIRTVELGCHAHIRTYLLRLTLADKQTWSQQKSTQRKKGLFNGTAIILM